MQNYLLTFAPFDKAKRSFYSFCGFDPTEIWMRKPRETFGGARRMEQDTERRDWRQNTGARAWSSMVRCV
jgi:hypothetical protein